MEYTVGIVAVIIAASFASILCAGSKYEKICTSVACAVIAIAVITPLTRVASSVDKEELTEASLIFDKENTAAVVKECTEDLELKLAEAVAARFPGSRVGKVEIVCDDSDVENIIITKVSVSMSGVDRQDAVKFISELLYCDNVSVEIPEVGENAD